MLDDFLVANPSIESLVVKEQECSIVSELLQHLPDFFFNVEIFGMPIMKERCKSVHLLDTKPPWEAWQQCFDVFFPRHT